MRKRKELREYVSHQPKIPTAHSAFSGQQGELCNCMCLLCHCLLTSIMWMKTKAGVSNLVLQGLHPSRVSALLGRQLQTRIPGESKCLSDRTANPAGSWALSDCVQSPYVQSVDYKSLPLSNNSWKRWHGVKKFCRRNVFFSKTYSLTHISMSLSKATPLGRLISSCVLPLKPNMFSFPITL